MIIEKEVKIVYPKIQATEEERQFCKDLINLAEDFKKNDCPMLLDEIIHTFVNEIAYHGNIDYTQYY